MTIIETLLANPVFTGVGGAAALSTALYLARSAPVAAYGWIKRQLTVTIVLDNDDELFDRVCIYLSTAPFVFRARWLRMTELYDQVEQRWCWKPTFGLGWHIFREDGAWFVLHRSGERDAKALIPRRMESLQIYTWGKDQGPIRRLMRRAEDVYDSAATVRVYFWAENGHRLVDHKPARHPSTVFLPDGQRDRLLADVSRYIARKDEYRARGTPWRRGYLFEGPPGTGKSSLAFLIASVLSRPIYLINPVAAGGDAGLLTAFAAAEPGAIIVIEDIDTIQAARRRGAPKLDAASTVKPEKDITLAGLLNAIDGIGSRDNRILVMTSNHPDVLDPALVRPGRVDVRELIDLLGCDDAAGMARAWGAPDRWIAEHVVPASPLAASRLQELLWSREEQLAPATDAVVRAA